MDRGRDDHVTVTVAVPFLYASSSGRVCCAATAAAFTSQSHMALALPDLRKHLLSRCITPTPADGGGPRRTMMRLSTFAVVIVIAAGLSPTAEQHRSLAAAGTLNRSRRDADLDRATNALAKLPVAFVENRGQTDARVRYYAQGSRYAFYLTADDVELAFASKQPAIETALALRFVGRNPASIPEGALPVDGEVNYFLGSDPTRWTTHLQRYSQIVYRELWHGVDLRLHENAGVLKYEFRVRPGANVDDIQLEYAGADAVTVDDSGALLITTAMGVLRDSAPDSYQEIDGARVRVPSRYVLQTGNGRDAGFTFAIDGNYRRDRDLIIDPGVAYSTFLGGSSHETGAGIAVDASGNTYIVGTTQSPDFPTTAGAFGRTGAATNVSDVFVTKLNATGTALVYSTFIGGSDFDFGRRIAVDGAGNAYITGQTKSSTFPTTGAAFDRTFNIPGNCPRCAIDNYDAFVTKLNATGSALVYSTFLGGTDIDDGRGIAVDAAGNAYVIGETVSIDFPTTAGAISRTNHGAYDVFVTKLNASGSALVYSTYLGGTQVDNGERIVVDADGSAYAMGFTSSIDFPVTAGAFDTTANGSFDVFVAKINAAGSALVYSTYLGGSDSDSGGGLAIDSAGNAYISGGTASLDFPTTPGAFDTLPNGGDAFVTKLNATGSGVIFSSLLGGSAGEGAAGIALDGAGHIWLTGTTSSADFPTVVGAADLSFNGVADAFVSELSADGSTLLYSSFFGGTQSDSGTDLVTDASGNVFVTGQTYSSDFPVTAGAFDVVFRGDPSIFWGDAFVMKITADTATSPPPPPAPATLSSLSTNPSTVVGGNPSTGTVTLSAAAPAGGAAVSLSDNSAATTVPASVTVPAGATSANFTVTTMAVTASTSATISAMFGGVTQSAVLTVNPSAPPPSGQTATLTVTATGRSGERVTSTPAGINVATGSTGSASFTVGASITLTVSNGRDAIWSGACSSGGNKAQSCTLTLNAAANVTANVQ